ncbi:MAG: response regulator transcription factor [Myxococcota bacterium]
MRVLLVDDHPMVRRGIAGVLRDGLPATRLGEADSADEALARVAEEDWDVVLLDITLGEQSGLDVLERIHRERPRLPVLIVTAHPEEEFAVRCLRLGAAGYLEKDCTPAELLAAVRKVMAGGRFVSASLAERLASLLGGDLAGAPHEALSSRELQVLRLVARGRSAKQVADELGLSEKTVSTYRARIATKLGVSSAVDLTRYALAHKLVD